MQDDKSEKITYLSVPLLELSADRDFPGNIHLCLHHKMVRYRNAGDSLDAEAFNKLVYNHVRYVFIDLNDRALFEEWLGAAQGNAAADAQVVAENPEAAAIVASVADQRRAMMDIFSSPKDDRQIKAAIDSSKKMVSELLRKPFAINNIQSLQRYSKGALDHSVNVSVLCTFLGLRMGYSHQLILENLALGGLFHDMGKMLLNAGGDASGGMVTEDDPQMQQHPKLGAEMVEKKKEISNEVRLIVAQHHEYLDGTGYPNKLKGLAIYDLARLVTIANIYDNLVSDSTAETMKERSEEALNRLENDYVGKLDPKKLEKVLKVLRYSLA